MMRMQHDRRNGDKPESLEKNIGVYGIKVCKRTTSVPTILIAASILKTSAMR